MKTIKIESGVKYLSESKNMDRLPKNCLFDKGKVGCGGTTLAIDGDVPYIIAVPFISLIENKCGQHSEIFGFYGDTKVSDLKLYIDTNSKPVIMTTYDSLEKVMGYINPKEFNLLVDEYHLLFTQYSFRDKAIDKVLRNYNKFKEYCFMTATPLEEDFILDELKELEVVTAEWDDVIEVSVNSIKCVTGVINTTIDIINNHLSSNSTTNLYIFVNSVKFIKDIVAEINLTDDICNVIYSNTNKTDVGIKRGILPSKKDGSLPTKKINLLTSTVFEGSDIYDENGLIYIVSDASMAHTLTDISTSFQQIAGRIRNSKYINTINHIYSNTRYIGLTYETFKELSNNEIIKAKRITSEYNKLSEDARRAMTIKPNESYITETDNNLFYFNPNLVKLDLYNFKICKHLYKIRVNNLFTETTKYGYVNKTYTHTSTTRFSPKDLEGFKSVVENIKVFYANYYGFYTDEQIAYIEAAYLRFPFLKNAIEKLGFEGIEAENYVQTNIKRKLIASLELSDETRIFKLLKTYDDITAGNFISTNTLKNRFSNIYTTLNIKCTPKGKDIEKFFYTNEVVKRIDGNLTKGYIILNPKLFM